jgi:hypothetical protein
MAHFPEFSVLVRRLLLAAILVLPFLPVERATAQSNVALNAWFDALSLSVPSGWSLVLCHGFTCHTRTPIALGPGDRAALAGMVKGATPDAERKGIARAMAWFDKRVGKQAGTSGAKAYAGGLAGDASQFDCIDRAANTTSLLLVMEQGGLLKHHRVDPPESRKFVPLLEGPHTTAVLRERVAGSKWVVDPWPKNSGELPDVMPLEKWHSISTRTRT